jgi:hypothetical protein
MRNINNEIEMKHIQMRAIHILASDLLSEGKLEHAMKWIEMWEDILHDVEILKLVKENTSIVQISIQDVCLN